MRKIPLASGSFTSARVRVEHYFRRFGSRDALRLIPLKFAAKLAGSSYRSVTHPYLYEFDTLTPIVANAAEDILMHVADATPNELAALLAEHATLGRSLAERYAARKLPYPPIFAVTHESSFLLYSLVRLKRFNSVVETGVANGHSTYYLLQALRANGTGQLHSIDVGNDVGALLDPAEREGWSYHRLNPGRERADFRAVLDGLACLDLFLHDSDHTYPWQLLEYRSAWAKLSRGGFLASDDVDHSFAFIDFCAENQLQPALLMNSIKVVGLLKVS